MPYNEDIMVIGLRVNDSDNVATIFDDTKEGYTVKIVEKDGSESSITALNNIPYGHKIALKDISENEKIMKYGEQIGIATKNIKTGEHVHIHNLDSTRGRGDLSEQRGGIS